MDVGPNWADIVTAVSTGVATVIVLATARFARNQLRDARSTRHGQLITDLSAQWTEQAAIESRGLYGKYSDKEISALVDKLYGDDGHRPTTDELRDWGKLSLWANRVEALGVLADEKALDANVIYKLWGGGIMAAWSAWEEAVMKLRAYDKEPDTFYYFEEIAREMRRISADRKSAISSARDPQADEAGARQMTVQKQPFHLPLASDLPNRSASVTRWAVRLIASVLAVSATVRAIRRGRRP